MGNLRDAVGSDLVTMLVMAQQLSGRERGDADDALPPEAVRLAVLSNEDTDDAIVWYNDQRDWQVRQRAVIEQLEMPSREMALVGELPSWMAEPWAKFIMFEWSHRLGWAVEQAEEWLAKTTGG